MPKYKNVKPAHEASGRGGRQRHLSVRSELRKEPDLQKIARAVIGLAIAQAERDAALEDARRTSEPNMDSPNA